MRPIQPVTAPITYSENQIGTAIIELEDVLAGRKTSKWPISMSLAAFRRNRLLTELYFIWADFAQEANGNGEQLPKYHKVFASRAEEFFAEGLATV
jgi:hypothetical protein